MTVSGWSRCERPQTASDGRSAASRSGASRIDMSHRMQQHALNQKLRGHYGYYGRKAIGRVRVAAIPGRSRVVAVVAPTLAAWPLLGRDDRLLQRYPLLTTAVARPA